jgi:hypothetical protein
MKIDLKRAIEVLAACGYECDAIEAMRQDCEPFGYYENGRWSVSVDGGPDKWRERKAYQGPIYVSPQPLRELSREEVIDSAERAGFYFQVFPEHDPLKHTTELAYSEKCFERFAKLVREAK